MRRPDLRIAAPIATAASLPARGSVHPFACTFAFIAVHLFICRLHESMSANVRCTCSGFQASVSVVCRYVDICAGLGGGNMDGCLGLSAYCT